MADKIKVSDIRAKFPMYGDLSDDQLLSAIRQKFYADIPMGQFAAGIDYDTQRAALQQEVLGDTNKFVAGYGKAGADIVRGVGQLVGLVDQESVDETKRLDAPLLKTGAGMAGNITGNIAAALPAIAIPGAATLPGAAAVGAGLGFMQPVASDENRLLNTAIGAGANVGGVVAGRAIKGAYQGAKALVEPFTEAGRDRIAGRVLQRFADDPASVAAATSKPTATGARPTLAEQTGDRGIARLQDSLRSLDPQIENQIGARLGENNAARVNALQGLAGDSTKRAAAEAARETQAGDLYRKAFAIDGLKLNAAGEKELAALVDMPAIQSAMKQAQTIAKNKGIDIANPEGSAQGLHYMKLALDDAINAAGSGTAAQRNAASGITAAKERLVAFLDDLRPDYKAARAKYAELSKPINAMDIGDELARRGTSNLSDLAGNQRMQANALAGMLRDEPALIQRATGRKGINSLADVLDPQQMNTLRAVAAESDRAAAVAGAGNGPGSATAQRMASQNILQQLVGPTGLPSSWAESALANTVIGKPLNLIYGGVAEPKIQQALAKAVLDPDSARAVLQAAQAQGIKLPDNVLMQLAYQAARSTPAATQPGRR